MRRSPLSVTSLAAVALAVLAHGIAPFAAGAGHGGHAVHAQELPLLSPETVRLIKEEISGDHAYEHIRHNTRFHRQRGGADGLMEVARYYEARAREYGLQDVRLIVQDYWIPPWNARSAVLWVDDAGVSRRLASYLETPLRLADYSQAADVRAELVHVGSVADYEGRDVQGRIVLAHGPLAEVHREAVLERGAAGIVWYPSPYVERNVAYPDQVNWSRLPTEGPDGAEPRGFAFILTLRQGLELRERVEEAGGALPAIARVDADFDSEHGEEPWQVMVEAYIRGTDPAAGQDVVFTGHMQEEKFSANDDASGTASILEIGRALNRLIREGWIERPRRNLRFWWVTEFSSQRQYFADNPEAHREMWVNVNQDMVGANQAQDVLRVQNVTRLPASRFHFFNDVVETVIDHMVATNTAQLAQVQAGSGWLYPDPHLSTLGSRHRYAAEMIFFHANTDHITFNEAPIGVPGVSFTNWPDFFIHTSDDDLWNVDRTQLGRNAVAGALIGYIMATADEGSAARIAAATAGKGGQRLAENVGLGLSWIAGGAGVDAGMSGAAAGTVGADPRAGASAGRSAEGAWREALGQLRYAAWRERRAARSLAEIGPGAERWAESLLREVDEREEAAERRLREAYRLVNGGDPPDMDGAAAAAAAAAPGGPAGEAAAEREAEERLAALRPALTAGPREFLESRPRIRGAPGLHNLMAFEVLNLVDGERSGLEIQRLVAAQAREAGSHYYGVVRAEDVLTYFENVAELGLIRLE